MRRLRPPPRRADLTIPRRSLDLREPRRAIFGEQGLDDLVEGFPAHHLVDLVEREVDAVVAHSPLREIIGADALRAVAGADLALARRRALGVARLPFHIVEAGTEHLERLGLVLVL